MGGESRDNNGHLIDETQIEKEAFEEIYHMKPVYEGYFYTIHWVPSIFPTINGRLSIKMIVFENLFRKYIYPHFIRNSNA